jgi:lipopolysaccharide biosynthesis glycosyltransferase
MTIKLFIGTSPNGFDEEIENIYEYSLLKHSSKKLDITWMSSSNDQESIWNGWKTDAWFTPFSGFRWAIPEICQFEGRAIYTDVDMINLKDIEQLYSMDLKGKPFAARRGKRWGFEFCVMVIDCKAARDYLWKIGKLKRKKDSHKHHRDLLISSDLVTPIDPKWNCLDGEDLEISNIYQLHFTNMATQPWQPAWFKGEQTKHPRADITELYNFWLKEVNAKGFKSSNYLNEHNFININIRL